MDIRVGGKGIRGHKFDEHTFALVIEDKAFQEIDRMRTKSNVRITVADKDISVLIKGHCNGNILSSFLYISGEW